MKNEKHLYQSFYKTLPALLILLTIYTTMMPENARAQNPPPPGIEVTTQNNFGERFRAGRDSIDRQEWARATVQFREALEKNPDHKLADAALYWLAFCYKKQKKFEEADVALDRLLKEFPASPWTSDAQVMKTEILPFLRKIYDDSFNPDKNPKFAQGQFSADLQAQVTGGTVNKSGQNSSVAEKPSKTDRMPLARADEIKLAAFQSLLAADPKRAIETMGEILTPDSSASELLKREILRVWRRPRLFASQSLVSDINQNIGGKEFVSLLRETLVKSFQTEKSLKIRIEIIYTLASLADEQSLDFLKRLYARAETERDIKKDILNSFGGSASVFYPFSDDIAQKKISKPTDTALEQARKIELDFLLEIVRAEKDAELRRLAFSNLRHFKNWAASAPAIEMMTGFYDAETDEEFKLAILRVIADSKQPRATEKLLDIAKNDRSDKLRLEAIYSLRTSKNPEVIKFLQDLIK